MYLVRVDLPAARSCSHVVGLGVLGLTKGGINQPAATTLGVKVPSSNFSFPGHLVGWKNNRARFDCKFAWHFSHRHESFSVRV